MLIISEDSTATWTRYLPAGSAGSSILNGLAPLEVSLPLQFKLPFTSMEQEPPVPPMVWKASAPAVVDSFWARKAGLPGPEKLNAYTPTLVSEVPTTPEPPLESPQTPAFTAKR